MQIESTHKYSMPMSDASLIAAAIDVKFGASGYVFFASWLLEMDFKTVMPRDNRRLSLLHVRLVPSWHYLGVHIPGSPRGIREELTKWASLIYSVLDLGAPPNASSLKGF